MSKEFIVLAGTCLLILGAIVVGFIHSPQHWPSWLTRIVIRQYEKERARKLRRLRESGEYLEFAPGQFIPRAILHLGELPPPILMMIYEEWSLPYHVLLNTSWVKSGIHIGDVIALKDKVTKRPRLPGSWAKFGNKLVVLLPDRDSCLQFKLEADPSWNPTTVKAPGSAFSYPPLEKD